MVREINRKIVEKICDQTYSKDDEEKMEYVLNVLFFESIKIIVSIFIFYLVGYGFECFIAWIVTVMIKPFIGGYHEYSQGRCFLITMLLLCGQVILSKQCLLNIYTSIILLSMCIFAIYNQAPMVNPLMPLTRPENITKNRRIGLFNVGILSIISIYLCNENNSYSSLVTWTIIILTIFMFNKKTKNNINKEMIK